MKRNNIILIILALGTLLLVISGTVIAQTVWVKGTVTKAPWVDDYTYIEVDEKEYKLMPQDVRIEREYQTPDLRYERESITIYNINEGDKIKMRVQGRRIYQVLILDY